MLKFGRSTANPKTQSDTVDAQTHTHSKDLDSLDYIRCLVIFYIAEAARVARESFFCFFVCSTWRQYKPNKDI